MKEFLYRNVRVIIVGIIVIAIGVGFTLNPEEKRIEPSKEFFEDYIGFTIQEDEILDSWYVIEEENTVYYYYIDTYDTEADQDKKAVTKVVTQNGNVVTELSRTTLDTDVNYGIDRSSSNDAETEMVIHFSAYFYLGIGVLILIIGIIINEKLVGKDLSKRKEVKTYKNYEFNNMD